jgi:DNA-binding transcriptional LysR family regulator
MEENANIRESIFRWWKTRMDWNNLKFFLAVARLGGLTPAATALATSVSTVSRHIDALEVTLGVTLFLRRQQGYLLTDAGSALLGHVAEVERSIRAVERQGDAVRDVTGVVRLATFESIAHYLLMPALPAFTERYPQLQVELLVNRNLADLSRREAELALRIMDPKRDSHDPDTIAQPMGRFRFELYCTPEALARVDGDWRQLPHVSWDAAWFRLPMVDWLKELFPGRAPVLRSNSMQTHLLAATTGLAAALLPDFMGDGDDRLVRATTVAADTHQELWLLYHRDLRASARVMAMRDFLAEVCRGVLAF